MAANHDDREKFFKVLTTFHESGLHRRNHGTIVEWPKRTYCIFRLSKGKDNEEIEVVENDKYHAEINSIKMIEEFYRYNKGTTITLFMNYSPCSNCSINLRDFIKKNKKSKKEDTVELKIFFVQLYNINRPSCREAKETCCNTKANENEKGLKKLNKYVPVKSFSKGNWDEIFCLLKEKYINKRIGMKQLKKFLRYINAESDSEESDTTETTSSNGSTSSGDDSEDSDDSDDSGDSDNSEDKEVKILTKSLSRAAIKSIKKSIKKPIKKQDKREDVLDKCLKSSGRFKEDEEIKRDLETILE